MKYYVYIIIDRQKGIRYKGMTEDLSKRLKEHNSGKTQSTKRSENWELEYFEEFS